LASVIEALRGGVCPTDAEFDQFLSEPIGALSARHWTPLAVTARAARWFDECNVRTVLDIGSGPGKFCVAGALACRCHFTGLEHRRHLVESARMLARAFGVENNAYFIHGALGEARLPNADAYYLYNPFEENVMGPGDRIDDSVELGSERMTRDIAAIRALLARAPAGTYVLVYNGYGGKLPADYTRVRADLNLPNALCLWRKAASRLISPYRPGGGEPAGAA
jgi:SAM-dependent methyltransferase